MSEKLSKLMLGSLVVVFVAGGVYIFRSNNNPADQVQAQAPKTGRGGMGMMQPQTPPDLTDAQKAQLAAGSASHQPTSLTFSVVGGSFFYVPNEIHVKKGDKVTIDFSNAGGIHNFNLDAYNVHMATIKTGESTSTTFTADQSGSFEYYCSIGQHRQMGQKGTLVVE